MKKLFLTLFLLLILLGTYAQTVENITVEPDGDKINIHYRIGGSTDKQVFNIQLTCSVDGGPDKSVFLDYLIRRLDENMDTYLASEQLFSSLRIAVMNNSPNIPQYGTIQNVGDEGGDFIFIRR